MWLHAVFRGGYNVRIADLCCFMLFLGGLQCSQSWSVLLHAISDGGDVTLLAKLTCVASCCFRWGRCYIVGKADLCWLMLFQMGEMLHCWQSWPVLAHAVSDGGDVTLLAKLTCVGSCCFRWGRCYIVGKADLCWLMLFQMGEMLHCWQSWPVLLHAVSES